MAQMVYTVEQAIDGVTGTLVIRRLTAAEWVRFQVGLDRLNTAERAAEAVPDGPAAAADAAAITAALERRNARAEALTAEGAANMAYAAWVVSEVILSWDGVPGADLWDRYYTRGPVWASLVWAVWTEHILSDEQKKTLRSRSGSISVSAGSPAGANGASPVETVASVGPGAGPASGAVTA